MRHRVLDSYARESAAGDSRNTSILGQHETNAGRIEELDGRLGERLDDKGKSAWKPGVVRPDWERLITRLESGESDGAVIFDMERLLRTVEDAFRLASAVKAAWADGRKVLVYDSDGEFDITTPQGEKNFYDAAVAAQYYSHRLSTRVRRGNRRKATRGEGRRGRYRPSGFEEDGATPRESERPHIRRAAERALEPGAKWQDICDKATAEGFYSPAQIHTVECAVRRAAILGVKYRQYACDCPQKPWEPMSLRSALLAPRMAGYVKLGPDLILGRMPGEPHLDPEVWQALTALVQSRRGRPAQDRFLCTGKECPVRCGDCGGYFAGIVNSNGRVYPDGVARYYYACLKNAKVKGCGRTIGDWRAVDTAVSALVIDRLSTPEQIAQIKRVREERRAQRQPHEHRISKLEELEGYWDKRLNEGKISPDRHAAMVDDLHRKLAAERSKLEALEEVPVPPLLEAKSRERIRQEWDGALPAKRRERLHQAYKGFHIAIAPGSSREDDVRHRISVRRIPDPA
ncbi:recombinase family protein [Streptomyces atriruber]|uniref:recombinase family protein n=1 Tax=Streptomyces atriruber TaxID=545121 RepID=UPI0006E287F5|nr:recombinase family protein [Streptomyces atriruber]